MIESEIARDNCSINQRKRASEKEREREREGGRERGLEREMDTDRK